MRFPTWIILFVSCWVAVVAYMLAQILPSAIYEAYFLSQEERAARDAAARDFLAQYPLLTGSGGSKYAQLPTVPGLPNVPSDLAWAMVFVAAPLIAFIAMIVSSLLMPFERLLPKDNRLARYFFYGTLGGLTAVGIPYFAVFVQAMWSGRASLVFLDLLAIPFGIFGGLVFALLQRWRRQPVAQDVLQ